MTPRKLALLMILVFSLQASSVLAAAQKKFVRLSAGIDKTYPLPFDPHPKGVTIGNKAVCDYTIVRAGEKVQIMFRPQKKGETNISIRDRQGKLRLVYSVQVTASNLGRVVGELKDLLKDIEGLQFRVVGDKIFIDGEIIVPSDLNRIVAVVQNYKENVVSLVSMSPLASKLIAKKIQEDIGKPTIKVRFVNGTFFLEGTVDNKAEALRAEEIAKTFAPDVIKTEIEKGDLVKRIKKRAVLNMLTINPSPPPKPGKLVKIIAHFVELSKSYLHSFGFKWQPLMSSSGSVNVGGSKQGGVASAGTSLTATISNLFPKLMSAREAGYARVLQSFTILTKNGSKASMFKGLEVGCPSQGSSGNVTVSQVKVGLETTILPRLVGQTEDVEMAIDFNFSTPSAAGACTGGINSNKMSTLVIVRSGESAAIGGVISSEMGTDFNKDPGGTVSSSSSGAQANPLFNLLRSKSFRKNKSQFVVFLTPQLIDSASQDTEDIKRKFRLKRRR